MESDDDLDPDLKYIPSQKDGLLTSQRIHEEHQRQYKEGTRRKSQLPITDANGRALTLVSGKAHWAEDPDMSYLEKMRVRALPASYTVDSAMSLVNPKRADTTNTSLRDNAKSGKILGMKFDVAGYDPEASRDPGGGLKRDIFYVSPYLTCGECNGLVYIDADKLRQRIDLQQFEEDWETGEKNEGIVLPPEPLPPCPGCGRTNTFKIGAEDLTLLLASNLEELERRKRVQKRKAKMIQNCYRYYLRRRYGRAQRHAIIIRRMLEARCAAAIQAMVRGRMGRRRFDVEKALVVIKHSHKMLLDRALHSKDYHARVYWYKTKTELDVLYSDYYVLCERTGYNPPLCVVETNIKEIAKRILEREAELATRVQSRWRGIVVRRYLSVYRLEVTRAREIMAACVFLIQRVYRGCLGRRSAKDLQVQHRKDQLLDIYQTEKFIKAEALLKTREDFKMKAVYVKERQEEKSARYTGLTNPKMYDGKKMRAFHESSYGDDSVTQLMHEYMDNVKMRKERDDDLAAKKHDRAEWARVEQSKDPGKHLYFEEEMRLRREGIIKSLTKERPIRRAASMLMEHNKKGIRFEYPNSCYNDPMKILKEDIVVREVRRDKEGKRIRTSAEKAELEKYKKEKEEPKKSKKRDGGRRGGITIGTIEAAKQEKFGETQEQIDGRIAARKAGGVGDRSKLPSFIKKAETRADAVALTFEKPKRVSNIKTKGRRDAAPAVISQGADTVFDVIDNF